MQNPVSDVVAQCILGLVSPFSDRRNILNGSAEQLKRLNTKYSAEHLK